MTTSKTMTVSELVEKLKAHNGDAEALVRVKENDELYWYTIDDVEDGGWENEDGSSPIVGLVIGRLILG